jgi:D-glycero-D-manno-heptose 1,7-bisphosphate phosphatase
MLAGVAVGCEPHLVLTGKGVAFKGRKLPDNFPPNTTVHEDLSAFADFLLEREAAAA